MNPLKQLSSKRAWILASVAITGIPARASTQTTTIVVPPLYTVLEAPGTAFWALSAFDCRRQLIIDEKHLGGLRGKQIRGFWIRRNMGDRSDLEAKKTKIKIELSHARVSADQATEVFAHNRGPDKTKVFDTEVHAPASAAPKDAPVSWAAPHAIELRLKEPFRYLGGPLCIETITDKRDKDLWWPIDAVDEPAAGSVTQFGSSCVQLAGQSPAGADSAGTRVGSTCTLYFRGRTGDDEAWCHLGLSDRSWNGIPLPFDLGPLGAPGCWIHIEMLGAIPIKLKEFPDSKIRYGSVVATIPPVPATVGMAVFSQWSVKTNQNSLELETSNGVRLVLGPPSALTGMVWIENPDPGEETGRILRGRFPVLRIDAEE